MDEPINSSLQSRATTSTQSKDIETEPLVPKDGDGKYFQGHLKRADSLDMRALPTENPLDDSLENLGVGPYQFLLLALCAVGLMMAHAEFAVLGFLQASSFSTSLHVTRQQFAIWASSMSAATMVSGPIFGLWADTYGRKQPFLFSIILAAIFGILSCFIFTFWQLLICRIIVAFGMGGLLAIDNMMFMEQTPASSRGFYTLIIIVVGNVAIIYDSALAVALLKNNTELAGIDNWRWFLLLASAPVIVSAVLRIFVSEESPRYLLKHGDGREAYEVMRRIARYNKVPNEEDVIAPVEEFETYSQRLQDAEDFHYSVWEQTQEVLAFEFTPWVTLSYLFFYIPILTYLAFANLFLLKVGAPPYYVALSGSAATFPAIGVMFCLIDHPNFGRLKTMKLFYALTALSFFIMTVVSTPTGYFVSAVLLAFSAAPVEALVVIYTAEIYPTEVRATAMGYLQFVSGFFFIPAQFLTAYLLGVLPPWAYVLIFFILTSCGLFSVMRLHVETAQQVMS